MTINNVEDANFIAKYIERTSGYSCRVVSDFYTGPTNWRVFVKIESWRHQFKPLYTPFYYKNVKVILNYES